MSSCLVAVPVDSFKFFFAAVSLSLAVLTILLLRKYSFSKKTKVSLIYAHLTSLFFPFVLFTTNMACGFFCLPCFENPAGLALLALPTTLLFSTVVGFVVIPGYYMLSRKSFLVKNNSLDVFIKKQAQKLNMRAPSLYLLKMAKPVAFSFKSVVAGIFLSVGLLDILKKKEVEAILLHELFHIKQKSSVFKLSAHLMRFSPFSLLKSFNAELGVEEERADCFAREKQGTENYLVSAKRKIGAFNQEAKVFKCADTKSITKNVKLLRKGVYKLRV